MVPRECSNSNEASNSSSIPDHYIRKETLVVTLLFQDNQGSIVEGHPPSHIRIRCKALVNSNDFHLDLPILEGDHRMSHLSFWVCKPSFLVAYTDRCMEGCLSTRDSLVAVPLALEAEPGQQGMVGPLACHLRIRSTRTLCYTIRSVRWVAIPVLSTFVAPIWGA